MQIVDESPKGADPRNIPGAKSASFDAFVSTVYMPRAKIRKRSWAVDERIARQHISPVFGASDLSAIKPFEVEEWLGGLRNQNLAASTCNRILAVFKAICSTAEKAGYLSVGASPARGIASFKVYETRERFLSASEAETLMRRLAASGRKEARALRLLLLTGARKGEILRARWENISFERRILTVPLAKGGRPRHIVLSDAAIRTLKSIDRSDGSPWVFPGRDPSKPIADIYGYWNKVRKELGLEDVRVHDLRHTFASFVVISGYSLYAAQQLLGHADSRATARYAHLSHDALLDAVQEIGRLTTPGGMKRKKREIRMPPGQYALKPTLALVGKMKGARKKFPDFDARNVN